MYLTLKYSNVHFNTHTSVKFRVVAKYKNWTAAIRAAIAKTCLSTLVYNIKMTIILINKKKGILICFGNSFANFFFGWNNDYTYYRLQYSLWKICSIATNRKLNMFWQVGTFYMIYNIIHLNVNQPPDLTTPPVKSIYAEDNYIWSVWSVWVAPRFNK